MEIGRNHLLAPFLMMMKGGVPCQTLIDVGCADGTFSLEFLTATAGTGKVFNIDANPVYSDSLEAIKSGVGGGYRICALSPSNGTAVLSEREHEYWRAIRSSTDPGGQVVECRSLDTLCAEHGLVGPYFIKMDIEGAELSALLGAEATLENTNGLVLETNIYYGPHTGGKFIDVYNFLTARGFALFDILSYGYRDQDAVLYQVYCAYLNRRHEFRHHNSEAMERKALVELTYDMRERRRLMRNRNGKLLTDLKAIIRR